MDAHGFLGLYFFLFKRSSFYEGRYSMMTHIFLLVQIWVINGYTENKSLCNSDLSIDSQTDVSGDARSKSECERVIRGTPCPLLCVASPTVQRAVRKTISTMPPSFCPRRQWVNLKPVGRQGWQTCGHWGSRRRRRSSR